LAGIGHGRPFRRREDTNIVIAAKYARRGSAALRHRRTGAADLPRKIEKID